MPVAPSLHYDHLVESSGALGESHQWMIRHVPDGSRVLDVGCAGGYLARVLRDEKGCQVDGVDLDPDAAERAREVCGSVAVGSLDDEAFVASLGGTYDRILCGDVLEHLRDPARVASHLGRLLAAEGRLLVSIPNVANWRVRLALARGQFTYEDSGLLDRTHLRFYTFDSVCELAAEASLRIATREFTIRPSDATIRLVAGLANRIQLGTSRVFPNLIAYQTLLELVPASGRLYT